jgi:hypothetical protein
MFEAKVDESDDEGDESWLMITDDSAIARLRLLQRQLHSERMGCRQEAIPAIKMIIGEWYVDELGVRTREITARA